MSLLEQVRRAEEQAATLLDKTREEIAQFLRQALNNARKQAAKIQSEAKEAAKKMLDEMEKETSQMFNDSLEKAKAEAQALADGARQKFHQAKFTLLEKLK